jgi:hypothetical protein
MAGMATVTGTKISPAARPKAKGAAFWPTCKSAHGAYVPPMIIYGRPIRHPRLLLVGALVAASALLPFLGAFA